MKNPAKLLLSILVCEAVGLLATPFTVASISSWYRFLNKPTFSPPNWVFGPVWTVLYLMMGIAFYLVWVKGKTYKKIRYQVNIFALQLFFNFLWSILFFGMHSPQAAFIDIIFLLAAILFNIKFFARTSAAAAWLLVPYFLWVSFASLLNLSIVILNP